MQFTIICNITKFVNLLYTDLRVGTATRRTNSKEHRDVEHRCRGHRIVARQNVIVMKGRPYLLYCIQVLNLYIYEEFANENLVHQHNKSQ